jgi:TonB family protein
MTNLTILLFVSFVSPISPAQQDPDRQLRDWAAAGRTDAIRTLLRESEQVDIGSRDEAGWTALMYAVKAGHATIVEMLLEAGANVHSENDAGETALHLAARHGRPQAARLLLRHGADLTARDTEGRTPFYRALEHRKAEVIEVLQGAAQAEADRKSSVEMHGVTKETTPPKLVRSTPALYTDSGLEKGIEGTVVLMLLVRRDGSVGPVSVSKSLEESLDRSAVKAVKKWEFEPATRGGQPVEVVVEIKVDFKLPKEG